MDAAERSRALLVRRVIPFDRTALVSSGSSRAFLVRDPDGYAARIAQD